MAASPERMGRRTRAEQRAATEKLILDTAEDLFSQRGYFGVTIKDVADAMGIHPALIHYYHAGKQAIFDAVFERRVGYAVTVRTAGLDAYEAQAAIRRRSKAYCGPIMTARSTSTSTATRAGARSDGFSPR